LRLIKVIDNVDWYSVLMKKLQTKTFFQKKGSSDCGPISTQIILDYFGIKKTEVELKEKILYENGATYLYDNGLLILREGLNVTLVTANLLLFRKEDQGKLGIKEDLFKHISKYARKRPKKKNAIRLFKDFVNHGGKVKIEVPTLNHIKEAIDKNKLVLAMVYARALGVHEGGLHFIVVSGYKKGYVHINNPLPGSTSGWFPVDDFMYALYSSTCFEVDNGSLLIVGK